MKIRRIPAFGTFALAMMNVAAVMNLRGLPMIAREGLSMVFYILFASLFFLIPVCLVSAELATGWPKSGGVYRWVKEAFGPRWGFLSIWLQWIQSVIWFPVILSFTAGSFSYFLLRPDLADNRYFNIFVILVAYWGATIVTFRGLKTAGRLTTAGVILGTVLPGILVIVLAAAWVIQGNPVGFMESPQGIVPDFSNFDRISFLAGIMLLYSGMEVGAVHVTELKDPMREYTRSLLLGVFLIIIIFSFGSLAIAAVLPGQSISLTAGIMQGFDDLLTRFDARWLLPFLGLSIAFGALGSVMAWISGPSRGLLAAAEDGDLPPFLARTNNNGIQTHILVLQAAIVSVISLVYVVAPSVSSAFFMLSDLAAILYLIMYIFLYAAAVRLRYSQPGVVRSYRIPGGNAGMWAVAGIGTAAVVFAAVVGFFPPSLLAVGTPAFYVGFLAGGTIFFVAAPLLIYAFRRPGWKGRRGPDAASPGGPAHTATRRVPEGR
jgi:putative glutamate/gamma-aminobutyrate antiporter